MVVLLSCCLGVCLCVLRDVGYQEVAFAFASFHAGSFCFFFLSLLFVDRGFLVSLGVHIPKKRCSCF